MDVLLPCRDSKWLRVSPSMARDERREHDERNELSTRRMLRTPRVSNRVPEYEERCTNKSKSGRKNDATSQQAQRERDEPKRNKQSEDDDNMDFDPGFTGFPGQLYRSPKKK